MNFWGQSFPIQKHLRNCALRHARRTLAWIALVGTTSATLLAQADDEDFTDLSLEELHAVSISAASKRAQPLFETPAAVSVLFPVDLSRAGAGNVADSLRLIPGVHVTDQLPGRWSIGVRGGNGVQSTKLLVLVDGRSVYNPFYGSVEWANAEVDIADLARVEVVRGPGATLWGANAVNGVVNVLSKDARETEGGLISFRVGTAQAAKGRVRYGARLTENTWGRIFASHATTEGALGALESDPMGGYSETRFGFRTDTFLHQTFQLTTQAEHLESSRRLGASPSTHQVNSALTRLSSRNPTSGDFQLQLYVDQTRDRVKGSDLGGSNSLPFALQSDTHNVDLDITHNFAPGARHNVILGGGARYTDDEVQSTSSLQIDHPRSRSWLFNLFIQDEITLIPETLRFTAGTKLEHHDSIGWELLPNLRTTWLPSKKHTIWAAVSRAARAPSRAEREVTLTLAQTVDPATSLPVRIDLLGNSEFDSEINLAYELGWRWRPSARFQTDATAYYFDYAKVRSFRSSLAFEPGVPPTIVNSYLLGNDNEASTRGAEVAWQFRVSDDWEVGGGLSHANASINNPYPNPLIDADYALPRWMWNLRSWWQLPRDWEFSTTLYGVQDLRGTDAEGYLRLDLQLLWRPRADLEISIGLENATDSKHLESITGDVVPSMEIRRNVFTRVQWRF